MSEREPVDLIAVTVPVLLEIVAVTLFIAAGAVLLVLLRTPVPV